LLPVVCGGVGESLEPFDFGFPHFRDAKQCGICFRQFWKMSTSMNSEIRSDDITLGILLGKSRFGDVFVGSHHRSSRFAVKRVFQYTSSHCRDALRSETNSMQPLRNLSSEFVVSVRAVNGHQTSPDQPVLLVMERLHESLFSAYRTLLGL